MSIFNEVKNQISVREAAQYYGFRPNRAGMIVCPFHNDRHGVVDGVVNRSTLKEEMQ